MPAKVKVKVIAGRNLPVMDRSNDTTDAYVELKLGAIVYKTDVCKKSLNPNWNTDWFRFEVDDTELQDEPLQMRLMDYDTYSANDLIGKVYIDLNPLLLQRGSFVPTVGGFDTNNSNEHLTNTVMSGWIPVYDTLQGIRGEVNIIVKVELFSDYNRFRQSSCGVQFFCSPIIPHGYYAKSIQGFVEELIVNDDPEYQWIDKIRTPRASNEARQFLLFKLYGELQRKIGLKTLELGGNAVVGYSHYFDLEGEFGIVARGIGSAVTLVRTRDSSATVEAINDEHKLNYLQFLRHNTGFHLNRNSPQLDPSFNDLHLSSQLSDKSTMTNAQLSTRLVRRKRNQASSLQNLLQQEDNRGDPAYGIRQHFRNVKYASQSKIVGKMNALKMRFSELRFNESLVDKKKKQMAELLIDSILHTSFDNVEGSSGVNLFDTTHRNRTSMSENKSVSEPHLDSNIAFASVINSSTESLSSSLGLNSDSAEAKGTDFDSASNNLNISEIITSITLNDSETQITSRLVMLPKLTAKEQNTRISNFDKSKNEMILAPLAKFDDSEDDFCESSVPPQMPQSIIPFVPPNILNINKSTLTKTAIQTMLLERVNIVGTYTPPSSPSLKSTEQDTFNMSYNSKIHALSHPAVDDESHVQCPIPTDTIAISKPVKSDGQGNNNMHARFLHSLRHVGSPSTDLKTSASHQRTESVGGKCVQSPMRSGSFGVPHRRSSDSDLSITPKGSSLTGSDKSYGLASGFVSKLGALSRTGIHQDIDLLDYPFVTINRFPLGYIIHFGGVVSARSVKRLDRLNSNEEDTRGLWWNELRLEIRAHSRALNCNAVLAYSEHATAYEGVCVLNATGTAAVVGDISECTRYSPNVFKFTQLQEEKKEKVTLNKVVSDSPERSPSLHNSLNCSICHVPYMGTSSALKSKTLNKCSICRSGKVADVILSTTEMPEGIPTVGYGCFIQAYVCRSMKDSRNEPSAKEVSDCLPFLEYELHRILMNKIKIKGMNALFGLKVQISIGAKMLVGTATGTAVFLLPLQPLPLPVVVASQSTDSRKIADLQRLLFDTVKTNREIYQLKSVDDVLLQQISPDKEDLDSEQCNFDSAYENRDCSILEADDPEDMEIMNLLMESRPPDGFHVVNTGSIPGFEEIDAVKCLQMFTQISRARIQHPFNLSKHLNKLLQGIYFKLRRTIPCALCNLQFRVDLPEADEIQLSTTGMALILNTSPKLLTSKAQSTEASGVEDDAIFVLEDDVYDTTLNAQHLQYSRLRGKSPQHHKLNLKYTAQDYEWYGVDITSMTFIPGAKVERYLGNINLFFIRESMSIREEGGLSGFLHRFVTEVLAIVRSHITALGGNAMLSYYMTQCVISYTIHKNQGQCLINVGGDAVFVSYAPEE